MNVPQFLSELYAFQTYIRITSCWRNERRTIGFSSAIDVEVSSYRIYMTNTRGWYTIMHVSHVTIFTHSPSGTIVTWIKNIRHQLPMPVIYKELLKKLIDKAKYNIISIFKCVTSTQCFMVWKQSSGIAKPFQTVWTYSMTA
jgi:hypothetical protein